ncbi:MAG TPA: LuxR C-terminal-related transcriptional regulator [Planctomycetota bacterium]|jgi:PAS domain S-box-containing protein
MQLRELQKLVDSTADAAFAVDAFGKIAAWNVAATEMFGSAAASALGKTCGVLVQGRDECGPVCSPDCPVLQSTRQRRPLRNFDLQVQTKHGLRWFNVSVLVAEVSGSAAPYMVHVIRPVDLRKRLEMLVRDFVVTGTGLPPETVTHMIKSGRPPAQSAELTNQEKAILRLLARGMPTERISTELHISRATVNNHVQHVLHKLDAHTRLEAIRRAERAGLI